MSIVGDRAWGVVDRSSGLVLNAKREGRLLLASARAAAGDPAQPPVVSVPGRGEVEAGRPELDEWLSAWLDRDVAMQRPDDVRRSLTAMPADFEDDTADLVEWRMRPRRFHDLAPVHVLTTASLGAMAAIAPALDWRVRRFRPTLLLDVDSDTGSDDSAVEQSWIGSLLHIGATAVVSVRKPTVRCVMTTRPQPGTTGDDPIDRQLDVLRTINAEAGTALGVYADVVSPGPVAVGDRVTIELTG